MHSGWFRSALDDLCRLASRTLKADICCFVRCAGKQAIVLGAAGTNAGELNGGLAFPALSPGEIRAFPEMAREAWFPPSAFAAIAASVKRLLIVRLDFQDAHEECYLVVFDPGKAQARDTATLASLAELSRVASSLMLQGVASAQNKPQRTAESDFLAGLQEQRGSDLDVLQLSTERLHPLVTFLMRSLVAKRVLRARKTATYVSLRAWRTGAKDAQLDALKVLKSSATREAIAPIVSELAELVKSMYAGIRFEHVVCVPCGHSLPGRCFSELLAQGVADALGLTFTAALKGKARKGTSHPKKSAKFAGFEIASPVAGPVLVIDDVVTSGVHVEKATEALRSQGAFPFVVVWIGS